MKRTRTIFVVFASLLFGTMVQSCAPAAEENSTNMKEVKKTLVIIDVQKDFYDPSGALYVQGSEALPERIAAIAGQYDAIILTLDWHPADHCSFAAQGGIWPSHCVAYTTGAGLPDCFAGILALGPDKVFLHTKAMTRDREQYGGFEPDTDVKILTLLKESEELDVCGIAGDYCVKETVNNMLNYVSAERLTILSDLVCSIDDGSTLKAFISEKGIASKNQ